VPESRELKNGHALDIGIEDDYSTGPLYLNPQSTAEAMQFSFEISRAHPALPGHFPGAPIIPAVVLIEHLVRGLEQATDKSVTNIRQLRLLRPIEPGKRIDVECQEKASDTWHLVCAVAGKPVAKGILSSQQLQTGSGRWQVYDQSKYQSAQAVGEQLPHAGAMQLIKEFALIENGAQTRAVITDNHPLVDKDGLPAWATLEYAAQLMACRKLSMGGEPMSRAVVVLVRSLKRYTGESMPVEGELMVEVTEEVARPGAVQCAFSSVYGKEVIAAGEFIVISES